jgi:hypothetical protein
VPQLAGLHFAAAVGAGRTLWLSFFEGERLQLERLTYVHNGDQGTIGRLIAEVRGVLRFGTESSGLIDVQTATPVSGHASVPAIGPDVTVRITAVAFSALAPDVREEIGEGQVPCILGHSGVNTVTLLSPRSIARVAPSLSDLRGKVRYALARVGWEL